MTEIIRFIALIALAHACVAGMPKGAENAFIRVEVADEWMKTDPPHGSTLGFTFSFTVKKPIHLSRVRIEDITTGPAVLLVDDQNPKLKKNNLWAGNSPMTTLNPQNFPWMFDGSNSKRLVRITVSTTDAGEFSLDQKMLFDRATKDMILRFEKGSHKEKRK
jgi:hypothetical protein